MVVPKYGFEGFIQFPEEDLIENNKLKQAGEGGLCNFIYNKT